MSIRPRADQPKAKRGRYAAAKYTPAVKQVVTGLFLAARDDSVPVAQFLSWFEKADTPVPKRTLLR
jgi:hypothetical protein